MALGTTCGGRALTWSTVVPVHFLPSSRAPPAPLGACRTARAPRLCCMQSPVPACRQHTRAAVTLRGGIACASLATDMHGPCHATHRTAASPRKLHAARPRRTRRHGAPPLPPPQRPATSAAAKHGPAAGQRASPLGARGRRHPDLCDGVARRLADVCVAQRLQSKVTGQPACHTGASGRDTPRHGLGRACPFAATRPAQGRLGRGLPS